MANHKTGAELFASLLLDWLEVEGDENGALFECLQGLVSKAQKHRFKALIDSTLQEILGEPDDDFNAEESLKNQLRSLTIYCRLKQEGLLKCDNDEKRKSKDSIEAEVESISDAKIKPALLKIVKIL